MSRGRVEPLYRKVNTRARGAPRGGLDYTPLYRFLLSSVGRPFREVHAEAIRRLDREEPIFHLVALREEDRQDVVRCGESTLYNGLYVDDDGALRMVAPDVTVETLVPSCACCTHTLNGVRLVKPFPKR